MNSHQTPQPPEPYIAHPAVGARPFVNRQSELEFLSTWAADAASGRVVMLSGIGGMGKTSLAWEWFIEHSEKAGFAARMWWSLYESDAKEFLIHCLSYLTGTEVRENQRLPDEEILERIFHLLENGKFLLVLEGLEKEMIAYRQQEETDAPRRGTSHDIRRSASMVVSAFLRRSPATWSASKILMTSRLAPVELEDNYGQPTPGAHFLALSGLNEGAVRQLLSSLSLVERIDEVVELAAAADYHPLTTLLIAGQAQGDPNAVDRLKASLQSGYQSSFERIPILDAAVKRLAPETRSVAEYIAALPSSAGYSTIARALVGGGRIFRRDSELDRALGSLQNLGLLSWDQQNNTYAIHPVVRAYLAANIGEGVSKDDRM